MTDLSNCRLSAVRVFTADFERSVEFYTRILGLTAEGVSDAENHAVFPAGEAVLIVEAVDRADDEASELIGRFVGASLAVDDIQDVYETLSSRGVRFESPPERQAWGGVLAHLRDPDDNLLTLVQPLREMP